MTDLMARRVIHQDVLFAGEASALVHVGHGLVGACAREPIPLDHVAIDRLVRSPGRRHRGDDARRDEPDHPIGTPQREGVGPIGTEGHRLEPGKGDAGGDRALDRRHRVAHPGAGHGIEPGGPLPFGPGGDPQEHPEQPQQQGALAGQHPEDADGDQDAAEELTDPGGRGASLVPVLASPPQVRRKDAAAVERRGRDHVEHGQTRH